MFHDIPESGVTNLGHQKRVDLRTRIALIDNQAIICQFSPADRRSSREWMVFGQSNDHTLSPQWHGSISPLEPPSHHDGNVNDVSCEVEKQMSARPIHNTDLCLWKATPILGQICP